MPDADAPSFKLEVEITDPNFEEAKNRELNISGKDHAAMLARVEARLRGKGSQ
jgi:post-segregation antitoxin (ccd killing protein)